MLTRRRFLTHAPLIALAPAVPTFVWRSAQAAAASRGSDRILVVLQLDGGNDGINTVVPYGDDLYATLRRELRLPAATLHRINDDVGLHPALGPARDLLDAGRFGIVQGVGYPNPNRSHFQSMAIWQSGRLPEQEHGAGWIGRAFDQRSVRGTDSIFVGTDRLPLALRGRRSIACSINPDDDLTLDAPIRPQSVVDPADNGDDVSAFVRRIVLDAYNSAEELLRAARDTNAAADYPGGALAQQLRRIAQLIRLDMPARVYYAIQSGYDTHEDQLPQHAGLLSEFSSAVKAFMDDIAATGMAERVLLMAFSEFGRRAQENGSKGTDHGAAGPVFLAGARVAPGLIGSTPRLDDLVDGDLKVSIDFRQVYATLLDDWLGLPSREALSGDFDKVPLLKL
jgi:uncharacterized protein (DUF1501 family)